MEISCRSDIGGGPEQLFKIIANLKNVFKFYCACPDQEPYYNKVINEGVPVFKLPHRKFEIKPFLKLLKWTKINNIMIVHSHGRGAGVYSRLLKLFNRRLKVVHHFHGIHTAKNGLVLVIERLLGLLTDKFVFVSSSEQQIALKYGLASVPKCVLVENGIQIKNGKYTEREKIPVSDIFRQSIPPDSFIIGMLSRFDIIKNIPYAIRNLSDYLKNHDDVFLVIGGDGEDRKSIECAISEYNLQNKVILPGYISDIKRFFLSIDIYLNTSLGEAFGLSTVEAMKYGKPVVASEVYGNSDVVDDNKTGLLFPLNKPSLLVERIKVLKNNKKIYDYLSNSARESVKKRFNLDRMLNETRELYLSFTPDVSKKRRMRIDLNVSKIFDVYTGVDRYASNLYRSLLKVDSKEDYGFYTSGRMGDTTMTDTDGTLLEEPTASLQNNTLRTSWEQIILHLFSRKDGLGLFHYTNHTISLVQRTRPFIITVHDIAYIRFPWLFNKSSQIYKKYTNKSAIRKADIIIVPSYSTKKDLTYLFGIRSDKIKVVCHGVESRFRHISNIEEYRLRNNLPVKMILYVGTLEPGMNIVTLIKAFKELRERGLKDYKLVVAGDKRHCIKQLLDEVKSNNLEQAVLFPEVVRDKDLPLLYNCARIFVYPSLYEGFGLPPLEAMACGIPVITSNTSSLPEVVGDAGIMVDPTDINSLSDVMCKVIKDKELRLRMRKMGLERSKLFSWEKAAKEILVIYDEALSIHKYQ